jgi:hypothetical protein
VKLINISDNLTVFPPVYVESELTPALNHQVVAELEKEEIFSRYVGEPSDSKPELPIFAGASLVVSLAIPKEIAIDNPFLKLEFKIMNPAFPLPKTTPYPQKPLRIEVSGGLEKYPLLKEGWENIELSLLKKNAIQGYKASYNVRLDLQTGSLFWHEPLFFNPSKKWDRLAEQILNGIQFDVVDPTEAIASGLIEITFLKTEESND